MPEKLLIDCSKPVGDPDQTTLVDLNSEELGQIDTDAPVKAAIEAARSTAESNRSSLDTKMDNALTANATFLGLASPTNAQVINQVQNLTRECSSVIRILRAKLDSTAGT